MGRSTYENSWKHMDIWTSLGQRGLATLQSATLENHQAVVQWITSRRPPPVQLSRPSNHPGPNSLMDQPCRDGAAPGPGDGDVVANANNNNIPQIRLGVHANGPS
ncbi:hypothetical protein M8J77_007624 [Diaphorina citri]|nr:hypothetical protein M8J77_007624 [Diaphorina citri]